MNLMELEYEFNKNILYKQNKDMLMAFNQDNGDMYEFNDVGAEIFMLIAQNMKMKDIFDKLTTDYDATVEDIYDDVLELVKRLIDLKIIEKK